MIISEDKYGLVSHQDFMACSNKMCETLEDSCLLGAMMIDWSHELDKQIPSLQTR